MAGYEDPPSAHPRLLPSPRPERLSDRSAPARQSRSSLARRLRTDHPDEEISRWLREVAAGRDPDAKAGATMTAPDWATRRTAMKMLLERRDGLPAQHITIEQEIRAELIGASVAVTPAAIAAMDPGEKAQLRALLRKISGTIGPVQPSVQVAAAKDANPIDV